VKISDDPKHDPKIVHEKYGPDALLHTEALLMIDRHTLASLIIDVRWRGGEAHHREMYFARRVNFWRDLLPERLTDALMGKSDGEQFALTFPAGEAVPLHLDDHVLGMRWDEFRGVPSDGPERPRFGRFYPWGLLRNIAGIFPEDPRPFRVSGTVAEGFQADLNHPLSGYSLDVTATVQKTLQRGVERGGSVIDWFSEVLDSGPGMQARCGGKPTDFGGPGAYRRQDDSDDAIFYRSPRIIGHIDRHANSMLENVYGDVLRDEGRVLDLMSSVESHLPLSRDWHVTGLGMNREEMAENRALEGFVVHDLNADPVLPFPDASLRSFPHI